MATGSLPLRLVGRAGSPPVARRRAAARRTLRLGHVVRAWSPALVVAAGMSHGAALGTLGALTWGALGGLALVLTDRWPIDGRPRVAIGVHGGATLVVAMLAVTMGQAIIGEATTRGAPASAVLWYALLTGLAHVAHAAQRDGARAAQLAEQVASMRLDALSAQLRPHFVLNALNTIVDLMYDDIDAADRMITGLASLLRHALTNDGRYEVTLREELALLREYVAIERVRFGDQLTVEWTIDPRALDARVPPLLLQPIVENAIHHGIRPRGSRGVVRVAVSADRGELRLAVIDDGVGFAPVRGPTAGPNGVGLANVRARLAELYGAAHAIEIACRAGGGTTVTLRLPFCAYDVRREAARGGRWGDDPA